MRWSALGHWIREDKRLVLHKHRWFAWHPVTIDDTRVWLETVMRQATIDDEGPLWEYSWA